MLSVLIAMISIGLGLIGWLAPRYTMAQLDMEARGPMAASEVRAASGALFVGLGIGALVLSAPGVAMVGFAWGGAAVGRVTSLILDGQTRQKWVFFGVEAGVAALALWVGL